LGCSLSRDGTARFPDPKDAMKVQVQSLGKNLRRVNLNSLRIMNSGGFGRLWRGAKPGLLSLKIHVAVTCPD